MGEARTQDFIANIVNSDEDSVVRVPRVYYAFRYKDHGYILMQHIEGQDCTEEDTDAVALVVKRLWAITPSPTVSAPGPVGGGPIFHRFFANHCSAVRYNSVAELQEHVNNVLARAEYPSHIRIDFNKEDGGKLSLCLDDIHPGNFRRDKSGQMISLLRMEKSLPGM
ncbi:hypothetical protein H1R20_g14501, partial [Candolleomyces eurysporus]